MKNILTALIGAVVIYIGTVEIAKAEVLTFDDLPENESKIPNGYGGLNWNNFYHLSTPEYFFSQSGYRNGTITTPNIAFNEFGGTATISISDGKFDLNSTYLTAAWNDGLNILVEGFFDEELVYSKTVIVDTTAPKLFNFNFFGINKLKFTPSSDGIDAHYGGTGRHFAIDNFTFHKTKSVPETFSVLSLLGVFCLCINTQKKSKK